LDNCGDCGGPDFDFDFVSGDTICAYCGLISDSCGIFNLDGGLTVYTNSKKYQTLVYMREKIRGLHGTDPWIWDDEWDLILEYIRARGINCDRMGQRSFSQICRSVKVLKVVEVGEEVTTVEEFPLFYKKYGERWVQARMRLGYKGPTPMSIELLRCICIRTKLYQTAHKEVIAHKITNKNAINLNYVLLQFIRMDSPDEFDEWKKFIKISTCKLAVYNFMWRQIMLKLSLEYCYFWDESQHAYINVEWTYNPLQEHDLYIPPCFTYI